MYVLNSLYAFVKVGDDLTGPKVSKISLQRQREVRSIRFWGWIDGFGWKLGIKHRDPLCSFSPLCDLETSLTTSNATQRGSLVCPPHVPQITAATFRPHSSRCYTTTPSANDIPHHVPRTFLPLLGQTRLVPVTKTLTFPPPIFRFIPPG